MMQKIISLLLLGLAQICAATDETAAGGGAAMPATGAFVVDATLEELAQPSTVQHLKDVLPGDEAISWEVFVPENYAQERPPGLLVYISPTNSGEMPTSWRQVMTDHNMIWVAANQSGNRVTVSRRVIYSLVAPTLIQQIYEIDRQRIYVSGFSGGGKTASMVAVDQAQLFRGAIYFGGAERWDSKEPARIDQVRQNRFVFLTGSYDQALEPMKKVYRAYLKAGIENSLFMNIRNLTHRLPDSYEFEKALVYLDADKSASP